MIIYVDASVVARVLLEEPESQAVRDLFDTRSADLYSSELIAVELHRIGVRERLSRDDVSAVLDRVSLLALDSDVLSRAARIRWHIKTLDALHLATCSRTTEDVGDDETVDLATFDTSMRQVADQMGINLFRGAWE